MSTNVGIIQALEFLHMNGDEIVHIRESYGARQLLSEIGMLDVFNEPNSESDSNV